MIDPTGHSLAARPTNDSNSEHKTHCHEPPSVLHPRRKVGTLVSSNQPHSRRVFVRLSPIKDSCGMQSVHVVFTDTKVNTCLLHHMLNT